MKRCSTCGETKPTSEFGKRASARDGLRSQCNSCRRNYRLANADQINAQSAAHYAANREQRKTQVADYKRQHPEARWKSTYAQRMRAFGFDPIYEGEITRGLVIEAYGDRCFHCGGEFEELDHYPIPVYKAGPHSIHNVRPACLPCNRASHRRKNDSGCSATGCDREFSARGLCKMHYERARRAGSFS